MKRLLVITGSFALLAGVACSRQQNTLPPSGSPAQVEAVQTTDGSPSSEVEADGTPMNNPELTATPVTAPTPVPVIFGEAPRVPED